MRIGVGKLLGGEDGSGGNEICVDRFVRLENGETLIFACIGIESAAVVHVHLELAALRYLRIPAAYVIVVRAVGGSGVYASGTCVESYVVAENDKALLIEKRMLSGYKLKLGKDVTKSEISTAWSLNKSTATATYNQTTTKGYSLADNAINYSKKSVEVLATIKGVKSLDGIKAGSKKITLKNSAPESKVTVSGGYEFDFAKDYNQSTIIGSTGNDLITTHGKKISIKGGKGNDSIKIFGSATTVTGGKGNDTLWGSSYADSFVYTSGDGKDVIYGFDDKDTLTLDSLDFISSYKNNSLALTVNGGAVTFKDFTATTFNINGDAYKISGAKLVKK